MRCDVSGASAPPISQAVVNLVMEIIYAKSSAVKETWGYDMVACEGWIAAWVRRFFFCMSGVFFKVCTVGYWRLNRSGYMDNLRKCTYTHTHSPFHRDSLPVHHLHHPLAYLSGRRPFLSLPYLLLEPPMVDPETISICLDGCYDANSHDHDHLNSLCSS